MRQARRRFFIRSVLVWMSSSASSPRAAGPPAALSKSRLPSTLRAYVDVLVPADETPSASALGIDGQLLSTAMRRADYRRVLELGLDWLDAQARADYRLGFADLDESGREAVVAKAATALPNTLPRGFFERTRADVFFHYYARPESWRAIEHYRGPPQPMGYPDFAEPPRPSR